MEIRPARALRRSDKLLARFNSEVPHARSRTSVDSTDRQTRSAEVVQHLKFTVQGDPVHRAALAWTAIYRYAVKDTVQLS
jgi:hypothetical protein